METEGRPKFRLIKGGLRAPPAEGKQQVGDVWVPTEEQLAAGLSQKEKGKLKLADTIGRLLRFDVLGRKKKTST